MNAVGALLLGLAACRVDLLPGEVVLGSELAAVVIEGEDESQFGASVAISDQGVLVGAPLAGFVAAYSVEGEERWRVEGSPGLGRRVWWIGEQAYAWQKGGDLLRVGPDGKEAIWRGETVTGLDLCPDGSITVVMGAGEQVSCGEDGILSTACDGATCDVMVGVEVVGQTTPGSAVAWFDHLACWGDAALETEAAPGAWTCDDGSAWQGLDGDHLGASAGGGWVGGVFNKFQVPARARLVPLAGGEVWVTDRASELSRLSVAADGEHVVVGVPGFLSTGANTGRVYVVPAP